MSAITFHFLQDLPNLTIAETLTDSQMWHDIAGHLTSHELAAITHLLAGIGVPDDTLRHIWNIWEASDEEAYTVTDENGATAFYPNEIAEGPTVTFPAN